MTGPQMLGSRTNVYMATDCRYAAVVSPNGDLLERRHNWGPIPESGWMTMPIPDAATTNRRPICNSKNVSAGDYAPTSVSQYCANSRY